MSRLPPHVAIADPDRWVVKKGGRLTWRLMRLGFSWRPGALEQNFRPPLSFESMGALAMDLRELGIAFSYGPGWAPSEVVQHLRDEGHAHGPFTEIAWGAGGVWRTREL